MGYLEYLKSRLGMLVPFMLVMMVLLTLRSGDFLAAVAAAWLASAFFFCIFSMLWLLGAVIGRKPRRQLTRLR